MSPRSTPNAGAADSPNVTEPDDQLGVPATADKAPDAPGVRIDLAGTGNGDAPIVVSDGITKTTYNPHGGSVRVDAAHVGVVLGAVTGSVVVDGD